jgi:hypothetical protein
MQVVYKMFLTLAELNGTTVSREEARAKMTGAVSCTTKPSNSSGFHK